MKRQIQVAVVVGLASLFAFDAASCFACSCVPFTKLGYADNADAIFTGKVLDVRSGVGFNERTAHRLLGVNSLLYFGEAVFQVESAHKGYPRRRQVVAGAGGSASCGFEFERGKTYTVFAQYRYGSLEANLCTGTVEGQIDSAEYGLPPEQSPQLVAPRVSDGIGENQPYGHARWVALALVATSAVTAAVLIRYLVAGARRLPFFKSVPPKDSSSRNLTDTG